MNTADENDAPRRQLATLEMVSQLYFERNFTIDQIANCLDAAPKRIAALVNELKRQKAGE